MSRAKLYECSNQSMDKATLVQHRYSVVVVFIVVGGVVRKVMWCHISIAVVALGVH